MPPTPPGDGSSATGKPESVEAATTSVQDATLAGPAEEVPRRSPDEILAEAQKRLPNRYRVSGLLGEGGMGLILRAWDERLGRDVAVKLVHGEEDRRRLRLLREARAGATVSHPGIVTVHDVAPGGEYIVMELVRGESLSARLRREKRLPPAEVRRVARELLDALGAAHRAGIVHRDVKPGNILLDESGAVKLADFGIASFGTRDLTRTGVSIGTPGYMAPEQLRGLQAEPSADVYAVGVTLFEAATGRMLHGSSRLPGTPHDLLLEATGDAALVAAIDRALREHPDERFADADAFARALDAPPPQAPIPAEPPMPEETRRLRGAPAGLRRGWRLFTVAVAAGVLALVATTRIRPSRNSASRRIVVAVVPFVDGTGDRRLDFARAGLPQILVAELDRVPGLSLVGYYDLLGHVPSADAPESAWTEAARGAGARIVLRGELERGSKGVRVEIRARGPSGEPLAVASREVPIDDVPAATRELAQEVVVSALGLPASAPTSAAWDFDAERSLQLGIAALESQDLAEADRELRRAADLAPRRAEPHYYLAIVDWWLSRDPKTDIDLALSGSLSRAQRGFLQGLTLLWNQSHLQAIPYFEALADEHPDDREILYGLFESYFHAARPRDAMVIYRRLCDRNPAFRLGLDHAVSYYVSHGDGEGMEWALARLADAKSPDEELWRVRASVARRDPAGATATLNRVMARSPDPGDDDRRELAQVYALSGQTTLALDVVNRMTRRDALALLALHIARGREDLKADEQLAASVADTATTKESQEHGWGELAAILATTPPDRMMTQAHAAMKPFTQDRHQRLPGVFTAALAGDRAPVETLRSSAYPDVAAVATAFSAEWRGDWSASATAWRRAVDATADGPFLLAEWAYLARARRAQHDLAGTIEACAEVIEPRRFAWSWGGAVGPCLVWSAEAQAKLGRRDRAKALSERLLNLRSEASRNDALVRAAREAGRD